MSAAAADKDEGVASAVQESTRENFRAWWMRVRHGDSGVLPVLAGLLITFVVFQIISPNHVFLTAGNLVNLFQQSAPIMVLAMGETFALLLGEIDLSIGYVAGCGAALGVQLVEPKTGNLPWWLAVILTLIACGVFAGLVQGSLVTRLRLPSFVVTLAGSLAYFGVMLIILAIGPYSGYPSLNGINPNLTGMHNLMWGTIDPGVSWILTVIVVVLIDLSVWARDRRHRRSGLVAPPVGITWMKMILVAGVGVAVAAVCDINRAALGTLEGIPWVIPIVLGIFGLWMVLLERTRFGRFIYAIGGNPEAARRAGINLAAIRTWAFVLCSATAGAAGLLYASYLGGASNNFNGGQNVLFAVAAAVIGGTSLFGGHGKVIHGVLGGLVIGAIYNGMYLLGLNFQWQYIVTGVVLVIAAVIDSVSRRGATTGSITHV